jgi:hypothetical protein
MLKTGLLMKIIIGHQIPKVMQRISVVVLTLMLFSALAAGGGNRADPEAQPLSVPR